MSQTDGDGINQFQQRKLAEQLAIGIAVRNATPEQLGHKVKKEEIITVSAKAAGEEAAAWAAKCAAQKQHPSRTTWQNVLFGIRRAPSPSGYQIQQQENRAIGSRISRRSNPPRGRPARRRCLRVVSVFGITSSTLALSGQGPSGPACGASDGYGLGRGAAGPGSRRTTTASGALRVIV